MNWYQFARLMRDVNTLSSGDPNRIARRARNKAVGRALARGGFWRWLWK
jgi:muconolactone delta-isomerase